MKIVAIPGDGIGPEIVGVAIDVVQELSAACDFTLDVETLDCGLGRVAQGRPTFDAADLDAARRADGIILGPMSVKDYPPSRAGGVNASAVLRRELDLYANARPARALPGLPALGGDIDLVIVRENLEDFYADRNMYEGIGEMRPTPDIVIAIGKLTRSGTERIAHEAFALAERRDKKRVTIVHKTPVLKSYYGMFVEVAMAVAEEYPSVQVDDMMVDAVAAVLVRDAPSFDVLLTPNMFGDILSDEAAELSGGLGLGGSLNYGSQHSLAQAAHGSAPTLAGMDVANPSSILYSTAMLLAHLGERMSVPSLLEAGATLQGAIDTALSDPALRTRDLGGTMSTSGLGEAIKRIIRERAGGDTGSSKTSSGMAR